MATSENEVICLLEAVQAELRNQGSEYLCADCVQELVQIEYDGASKGNPGPAGAGALIRGCKKDVAQEVRVGLGRTTNNVAEYMGLIAGLTVARDSGFRHVVIQGDSMLVTQQVNGIWDVRKPHLEPLRKEAVALSQEFDSCQILHVDRKKNSLADRFAREGIDRPGERKVSPRWHVSKMGLE